jgi:hypothetical protein
MAARIAATAKKITKAAAFQDLLIRRDAAKILAGHDARPDCFR